MKVSLPTLNRDTTTLASHFYSKRERIAMTKESQVGFAEVFAEKNANRKAAKEKYGPQYAQGRANRRELSFRGAFGKEDGFIYNQCSVGTIGGRSKTDNREDTQ